MATKKKVETKTKRTTTKKKVETVEKKEEVKNNEYKFDFIREQILSLNPSLWKKLKPTEIHGLVGFNIRLPFINLENGKLVTYPALDIYGKEINDVEGYMNQRKKYCENLGNEITKNKWWENNTILKEREKLLKNKK